MTCLAALRRRPWRVACNSYNSMSSENSCCLVQICLSSSHCVLLVLTMVSFLVCSDFELKSLMAWPSTLGESFWHGHCLKHSDGCLELLRLRPCCLSLPEVARLCLRRLRNFLLSSSHSIEFLSGSLLEALENQGRFLSRCLDLANTRYHLLSLHPCYSCLLAASLLAHLSYSESPPCWHLSWPERRPERAAVASFSGTVILLELAEGISSTDTATSEACPWQERWSWRGARLLDSVCGRRHATRSSVRRRLSWMWLEGRLRCCDSPGRPRLLLW